MKRTFFAIDLPPGEKLSTAISLIKKELADSVVRWTAEGHFHLTLKFLGDTHDDLIPGLITSVRERLQALHGLSLQLSSLGVFPDLRNPRVIWTGIETNPELLHIQRALEETLVPYGFSPEQRAFSPHLTLGRIKEIRKTTRLESLLERFNHVRFDTAEVKEILFFESQLKPGGPVYIAMHRFPLRGVSDPGTLYDRQKGID